MSQACGEVLDEVRRAIRSLLGPIAATNGSEAHLLDVGCWDGVETTRYAQLLNARAHGIEIFPVEQFLRLLWGGELLGV